MMTFFNLFVGLAANNQSINHKPGGGGGGRGEQEQRDGQTNTIFFFSSMFCVHAICFRF